MKTIRRILLLLDEKLERTPAVDRAVALAQSLKAELWLALHDRGPNLGILGVMDRQQAHEIEALMRRQVSERLADLRQTLLSDGVPVVRLIDDLTRLTAERVIQDIKEQQIDLVVKDVGHPSLLRRILLLPFDWALLRKCPVPVWLVGGNIPTRLPRRIVAAVDPVQPAHGAGPLNDHILEAARLLVTLGPSHVRVMSAFAGLPVGLQGLDPMGMSPGLSIDELYERLRADHRTALHALLQSHQLRPDAAMILYGPPAPTLLDALDDFRPDVLVVGTLQRKRLDRLFMGSTVERMVGDAPCDVLAIPAPATEAVSPMVRKTGGRADVTVRPFRQPAMARCS